MINDLPQWPVFGLSDDIRPALKAARDDHQHAALATIVALDGGGPRPVGTQMLISEGQLSGFLSGGCLEADVAHHATRLLAGDTSPGRLIYGQGSPWPDIRLLCGARIEVQLEAIAPDDDAVATLLAATKARQPAFWRSDGTTRTCATLEAKTPQPQHSQYVKLYQPVTRLIVLGSDPSALAIATLGAQAGFETSLIRPKGPAEPPPLAGVTYLREMPAQALNASVLDPWTAVAVATHDAETDHAALSVALPSPAFYVGALGARRRLQDRQTWLRGEGLKDADIERMRAPIGLDLGGKAPWEVAIAVIADIIATRYRSR